VLRTAPEFLGTRDDGRTWDRTGPEPSQQSATSDDSSGDLQGEQEDDEGPLDRLRTTEYDPAFGQGTDTRVTRGSDAPGQNEPPTKTGRRARRSKADELPFIHPGQLTVFDFLGGGDGTG